ncbi:hypothetical protein BBJ28_00024640, partial [Nothophytophthora sp. Chile5]
GRYLWSEVDRLKEQVQELQTAIRLEHEDRVRMVDHVVSFVTHAQLDAALSTKISHANVAAHVAKLRDEVANHLADKADLEALLALQTKKLDVSVFESTAWDQQKLRVALEQHMRDLFSSFASKFESQVSSKLAIEDFNRIFNPDANGQTVALDIAATRISRMTDQLESLQDYASGDRQRQRQMAELNVSMLDLTRKQTASRNAIVQLRSVEESTSTQLRALEEQTQAALVNVQALTEELSGFQAQTLAGKSAQDAKQTQLAQHVQKLETCDQRLSQTLEELQKFARDTLVDSMDAKLKLSNNKLHGELMELGAAQHQHAQQVKLRMNKTQEQLLHHKERLCQLDACLRKLATMLRETQGDLNDVKGPLSTLATNLREENVAILEEIARSQVRIAFLVGVKCVARLV